MGKITGLGGIFYVVEDPEATRRWYREVLGLDGKYGPYMPWSDEPCDKAFSLISHFADDNYIKPGTGGFMINLRVTDLPALATELEGKGVPILNMVEEASGKFAWILDPNGIKIELWEQPDAAPMEPLA